MKYKYKISEDSYDTRWFTLETDVKLDDDSDIFWEALGQVDITKEGDSSETEDTESEHTLEEAFKILKPHLKNSFLSVLLFTTTKDVTFKINKKGAGSIVENYPTFQNVTLVDKSDDKE